MEKALEEAKEFYDNLSKEELRELLILSGFEVEDGVGQIISTEILEAKITFSLSGNFSLQNSKENNSNEGNTFSFPIAC